jgi:predicted O-methyltransferase YrrM
MGSDVLLGEALNASDKVDGWLTSNEQTLLYNLARKVPADKAIVELGAWLGKSTIMLAAGSTAGAKAHVYAVDFFELHGAVSEQY